MAAALQSSLARATPTVQPGYNINIVSRSFGGTSGSPSWTGWLRRGTSW